MENLSYEVSKLTGSDDPADENQRNIYSALYQLQNNILASNNIHTDQLKSIMERNNQEYHEALYCSLCAELRNQINKKDMEIS